MELDRVTYLLPTYTRYRVAVLDEIYKRIGNGFTVITLKERSLIPEQVALYMGSFPRRIVRGRPLVFDKEFKAGKGNSARVLLTPGLPFILNSLKPQLLISEAFSTWTIAVALLNYPLVIYWEGTHYTERNIKPWKSFIRYLITKQTKAFLVNGYLSKKYLMEKFGVQEECIFEGGLCSEPPPSQFITSVNRTRNAQSSSEPVKFIFCGQLVQRKGPEHLLQAVALLNRRENLSRDFSILILGDGSDRDALKHRAEELGIADKVAFKGFIQPDCVWPYYAESDVFVLPTLHDNWPLVVPEAMSMKLPVLLSRYAGNSYDLVREGENGFIFEPTDHERLADLMALYIEDVSLIEKHGQRSAEIVSRYNPTSAADVYLKAIDFAASRIKFKSQVL